MNSRPWTAIPASRSSLPILKVKLYLILGLAAAAVVSGLFATVAWITFTPEVPNPADFLPRANAAAEVVARDFLAGRPTSVPAAEGVDTTFGQQRSGLEQRGPLLVSSISPRKVTSSNIVLEGTTRWYEIHNFTVAVGGELFQLDVTMLLTGEGPVLGAKPSLAPFTRPTGSYDALDYSKLPDVVKVASVSEPVKSVLGQWANAYARGNSQKLRELTGDSRSPGEYVGLGGFSVEGEPRIVNAVQGSAADSLVLQVELLVSRDSAQEYVVSTEYDVLVYEASSALPKVVAWGPPGVPTLTPYGNNPSNLPR